LDFARKQNISINEFLMTKFTLSVLETVERFCLLGDECFFFSFVGVEVIIVVAII
jgi:hypothetical protein